MILEIEIPDYEEDEGIDVIWEEGSRYKLYGYGEDIHLVANAEGLISFAKQMLYLAQSEVREGSLVHFDTFFCRGNETPMTFTVAKKIF